MSRTHKHVVKVGGSLLTRPGLGAALQEWLSSHAHERVILIAGGGALVEGLRQIDRAIDLDPTVAHWMAIDAMDITARVLHTLLPHATPAGDWGQIADLSAGPGIVVVTVAQALRDVEPQAPGRRLGIGWQVTSDSIAARLAEMLGAERLTLLKSAPWPTAVPEGDWVTAAARGYVDAEFPRQLGWGGQCGAETLPFPLPAKP